MVGNLRRETAALTRETAVPVLATVAGALDTATTAVILASPRYVDLNVVLESLAAVHLAVAVGVFAAANLAWVAAAWLRRGWLSTAVGIYAAVVLGTGGVNNLLLFATGTSVLQHVGGALAVHLIVPAIAALCALGGARRLHAPLPNRQVLAVGAAFVVAQGAVLVGW